MANILIVEDEKAMQDIIVDYMRKGGHACFTANDGIDALVTLKNHPMDLMILDVMMPHLDGFSVCKMAREMSDMPIIMLTAKSAEDDKLKGYDYGADDYMTKPFDAGELLARVRALTRRQGEVVGNSMTVEDLNLRLDARCLVCGENSVRLGFKEFEIMRLLMSHFGLIVPKETIISKVWGLESDAEDNNVEVYISFLRKKLAFLHSRTVIGTVRKLGYFLEVPEP